MHVNTMTWPHGAKCAVLISFDFDAETLWLSRDPRNIRNLSILSFGRYGSSVGVPKILELMRQEGIKSTFFVPGWTAEHHPDRMEAIVKEGHEIAHHGYLHKWPNPDDVAGMTEEIDRGFEWLHKTVGVTPLGYRSPAGESNEPLLKLLISRGIVYDSSFKDDIVPYRQVMPDGSSGLVELPENPTLDDCAYGLSSTTTPRPLFGKEHVLGIWQEEFKQTYEWGGLFILVLHPQVTGRPMRMAILRDFIKFTRNFSGVWYATGKEIYQAFLAYERTHLRKAAAE